MKGARGFTLIELLVALVIFGLLSVMAYGGLSSVLQTRASVEESLERTARLQKVLLRLRDDFQMLRLRPVRDAYGAQRAALIGIREPRVEFTRGGWRNPLLAPRPGLERVIYRLDDKKLVRESYRVLDQAQDSEPVRAVLLEPVESLRLRYLNSSREWVEEWPPATLTGQAAGGNAPPPLAVEVTLKTQAEGELVYLFRLGLDPLPSGFTPGQLQQAQPKTPATTPPADSSGNPQTPAPSSTEPAP